jgi:hypothetical protein
MIIFLCHEFATSINIHAHLLLLLSLFLLFLLLMFLVVVMVVVVVLLLLLLCQYCEILKNVGSILYVGLAFHFVHRLVFDLQSRHNGLETDMCPSTNKQAEEYLGGSVPTRSDLLC